MRAVCARTAVYQVQPWEFQLRPLRRGVVRQPVLVRACHLVRRGHQDAGDIFPEVRLRGAMAYQGAARWDVFGQVRLPDENSEARRDEVVRQSVALPVESETFGLAEERPPVALHPRWFLKPMRDFPTVPQRQDAARQERLAGSARQAEAERLDVGLMAQLRVLLGQRPQELLPASRRRVNEQADVR
jgi:hypothetical protein